ncbi:MAG: aminotransferase class V-fold PLP-dependent enzyme [Acidobacteria bacterium]|nr:aminotransferase class V-fold PLP-dependent enzyme [Acidobacteriota bacterium]
MSHPPLDPALFDLDPSILWVMHCAEGPIPLATARALAGFLKKELHPWEVDFAGDFLGSAARAREEAASLIGVRTEDVSLTMNTTTGLEIVAQGFPWREGDEVLLPLGEFPSNAWPWKSLEARGVSVREVPLWRGHQAGREAWDSPPPTVECDPEGALAAAISPRTRLVAASWVRFQDGLRLDLARLGQACAARGLPLVVDGIQGAGTHLPDLRFASAFATGGHKGLLTPQGIGFLWTREAFRQDLVPSGSWLSVEDGSNFGRASTDFSRAWLKDGRRLEGGGYPALACTGLRESLRTLNGAGIPAISAHVARLQANFLEGLGGLPRWKEEARRLAELLGAGRLGPILALHHRGRGPEGLNAALKAGFARGIHASVREGYLRLAFHGFHAEGDLTRLLAWLAALS